MIQKNTQSGFTLVELLFTLTIGVIFLTMAVPSYTDFSKNNRITTITNNLVTDINVTRSEAIARGAQVIMCRSADPAAATPSCGGTANTWTSGWIIFVNKDTNTTYTSGTDQLLRVSQLDPHDVTIKSDTVFDSYVQYNPDGTLNAGGSTGKFVICDDRGESKGNKLKIIPTGRPRLLDSANITTGECTTPV